MAGPAALMGEMPMRALRRSMFVAGTKFMRRRLIAAGKTSGPENRVGLPEWDRQAAEHLTHRGLIRDQQASRLGG